MTTTETAATNGSSTAKPATPRINASKVDTSKVRTSKATKTDTADEKQPVREQEPGNGIATAIDRLAGRVFRTNGNVGLKLGGLLDRRVAVIRTEGEMQVTATLHDVDEASIKVTIDDDHVVRIRGVYASEGATKGDSFDRAVVLDSSIDESAGRVILRNGVLTVRLPRRTRRVPRAFQVWRS